MRARHSNAAPCGVSGEDAGGGSNLGSSRGDRMALVGLKVRWPRVPVLPAASPLQSRRWWRLFADDGGGVPCRDRRTARDRAAYRISLAAGAPCPPGPACRPSRSAACTGRKRSRTAGRRPALPAVQLRSRSEGVPSTDGVMQGRRSEAGEALQRWRMVKGHPEVRMPQGRGEGSIAAREPSPASTALADDRRDKRTGGDHLTGVPVSEAN